MSRSHIRIFISSPGDVVAERRRAALVIERLAREYRRLCDVSPYLWEYEPMLASGHFQDVIDPPSRSDVVVLILWSRLGTALPEQTSHREYRGIDGRVPVTGTEWEFEEALKANRDHGSPDLLVYRSRQEPLSGSVSDREKHAQAVKQWELLEAFWSRHFSAGGQFKTAYSEFRALDEFAASLERDLRKLIEDRIRKGLGAPSDGSDALWFGNPFRALESYEYEHASVFFGRAAWIQRGVEQLVERAHLGSAFLLVVGASGAGKSSLVKAGLLPALFTRGVVTAVGLWRRVVFRPSVGTGSIFERLAAALVRSDESSEVGLPELLGPGIDEADLARHLAQSVDNPEYPFRLALGRVAEMAMSSQRMLPHEHAALILVLDQLEEIFTDNQSVGEEDRRRFARLLGALAQSGRVYVIATLRGDFWHHVMELPDLVALSEGSGRLDLLAPGQAELSEMIRRPAEVAGLSFEEDLERGVRLDADLAEAASRQAGSLPLLSAVLDGLYREDAEKSGGRYLTYATYDKLGRLPGAIARRAEAVLASVFQIEQPEVREQIQQVALARSLRALSTIDRSDEGAVTSRSAALSIFKPGSPERRLVEAMLEPDTRLLVADESAGEVRLRVAHEALLTNWDRAQRQLVRDRRDLETRARIEQAANLWSETTDQTKQQRLLRDLALAEAEDLLNRWGTDLEAGITDYIQASSHAEHARVKEQAAREREQRELESAKLRLEAEAAEERAAAAKRLVKRTRLGLAAAMALSLIAGLAAYYGWQRENEARQQKEVAEQQTKRAEEGEAAARRNAATADEATKRAEEGEAAARQQRDTALVAQSRFLADRAQAMFEEGNIEKGIAIALEALPTIGNERPVLPEVLRILDQGLAKRKMRGVLSGHQGAVMRAVFSPNGERILTASLDMTARLWDAESGRQLLLLRGHEGFVNSAAFSSDGARALTASDDKTARLWDTTNGRELMILQGHQRAVSNAIFSPDGKLLATASWDNTARLWDSATGRELAVLRHLDAINSLVFSPDGTKVLTASDDKTARLWDSISGRELAVMRGHEDRVTSATFSPDGKRILTGSLDKTARLWLSENGREIGKDTYEKGVIGVAFDPYGRRRLIASLSEIEIRQGAKNLKLRIQDRKVNSVAFSPDGGKVLAITKDNRLLLWSSSNGEQLANVTPHEKSILSAIFSADGRKILTASDDSTARLWYADSVWERSALPGAGSIAKFSPDGSRIVTSAGVKEATVWETSSGDEVSVLRGPDRSYVNDASFSPDGAKVVTALSDGTTRLWEVAAGRELLVLKRPQDTALHEKDAFEAVFSPDGTAILVTYVGGIAVWDAIAGTQLFERRLKAESRSRRLAVAKFSPDGARIATKLGDNLALLLDARDGRELFVFEGGYDSLDFSPDGKTLLTQPSADLVRLWDVSNGKMLAELKTYDSPEDLVRLWEAASKEYERRVRAGLTPMRGSPAEIDNAVFSPDGRTVLNASGDGIVRLWDVLSGRQIKVLPSNEEAYISKKSFSADSNKILVARFDAIEVWDYDPTDMWDREKIQAPLILKGNASRITSVEFSPDQKMVLTADSNGTARLWDLTMYLLPISDRLSWIKASIADVLSDNDREKFFLPKSEQDRQQNDIVSHNSRSAVECDGLHFSVSSAEELERQAMFEKDEAKKNRLLLKVFQCWTAISSVAQPQQLIDEESIRLASARRSTLAFLLRDRGLLVDAARVHRETLVNLRESR